MKIMKNADSMEKFEISELAFTLAMVSVYGFGKNLKTGSGDLLCRLL